MIYGVKYLNMELFKVWISRQLAENDWTYEELAKKIGGSTRQSSVSQWVNGKHIPDPPKLLRLAEITGEDPIRLFNIAYGLPMPNSGDREPANPIREKINRELNDIEDEQLLELILDQLKMVLKPHGSRMLRRAEQKAKENIAK